MPEWFDGVEQELSLIGAAPISFATALVVVIIVAWAILHWFYHRMLSSKDIQIEVLQSRLADYRNVLEGASPREAAYKITQLKGKLYQNSQTLTHAACALPKHPIAETLGSTMGYRRLAHTRTMAPMSQPLRRLVLEAIKGVPRDENAIFQNGKRIGEVMGVRIEPPNNSVVFDRMVIAGHLDQASHVEFKNLVLAFVGLDGFSQTRQGRTLVNAQFSIVGNRRD
jgi:hypothetical protein